MKTNEQLEQLHRAFVKLAKDLKRLERRATAPLKRRGKKGK